MDLIAVTRGHKMYADEFIKQLQGIYLKWHLKYKGKKMERAFQLGVKPIQLWDFSFPKEQKDIVLNTILRKTPYGNRSNNQIFIKMLQKMLKLEKIPEYDKTKVFPTAREHLEVVGIGVKDDEIRKSGDLEYEGL